MYLYPSDYKPLSACPALLDCSLGLLQTAEGRYPAGLQSHWSAARIYVVLTHTTPVNKTELYSCDLMNVATCICWAYIYYILYAHQIARYVYWKTTAWGWLKYIRDATATDRKCIQSWINEEVGMRSRYIKKHINMICHI